MAMRVLVLGMAVILLGCPEERGVDPDPVESTEQDSGVLEDSTDSSFVEDQSEPEPGCQAGDGDRCGEGCEAGPDCDDSDALVHTEWVAWVDGDGDGYTVGQEVLLCIGESEPEGYAADSLGEDCDDSDGSAWLNQVFFVDGDGDGYTTGEEQRCAGNSPPLGTATSSLGEDCDDADGNAFQQVLIYQDADGDGYTSGEGESVCLGEVLPSGTSDFSFGEDCDEGDSSAFVTWKVFPDADGDGYAGGPENALCAGPTGEYHPYILWRGLRRYTIGSLQVRRGLRRFRPGWCRWDSGGDPLHWRGAPGCLPGML